MKTARFKMHRWFCLALSIVLLCGDLLTKYLAVKHLRGHGSLVVVPRVLELTYWENTGAAFSSSQGMNTVLIVVTISILAFIGFVLVRIPNERKWLPLQYVMVLLLSGGLGNTIDRIVRGYVVDFIFFKPINFPTFNLADSYIVIAILMLFVLVLVKYKGDGIFEILGPKKRKS